MIGLLQRVRNAQVEVAGKVIASIDVGLLVFVGVERGDNETIAQRLLERLIGYRVFADATGKMNLNVQEIGGGLLLVPQFTLAADTDKGLRASFTAAATPEIGRHLFEFLLSNARKQHPNVASGIFGTEMLVTLTNDGPVTFWLESK
jgi:D-aminoacyl-tRNA deacylase